MGLALRPATDADSEFAYAVKKAAAGRYVVATWGPWDEDDQRIRHAAAWGGDAVVEIIERDGAAVGWIGTSSTDDAIFIEGLYVSPDQQGGGIGTWTIRQMGERAAASGRKLTLTVLKVNPAVNLYKRMKFQICGETETHWSMEQRC